MNEIQTVPIDSVSPDPANVRKHGVRDIDAIKASLKRFGQQHPILVDKRGVVRAGNGRLEAMRQLGWSEVEVVYTDLEGAELAAFAIADNRTAELSGWDVGALSASLAALKEEDEDLFAATGFDDVALAQALDGIDPGGSGSMDDGDGVPDAPREIIEDEAPEAPKRAVSKTGDLWLLGEHRLLCGDSTKAEDVERLMAGAKAEMMVTDPPYGVEYDADWRNQAKRPDGTAYGASALGKVSNDDRADWRESWALFHGSVAYVWHAGCRSPEVAESLTVCDFVIRNLIVWAKNSMVIGRGDYHHQHEPCWYVVRKGCPGRRTDDRTQTTLWQIDKPQKSETGHSTQKPVECMARPMRNHEAELIYDPFLGSGTTLIAAEQLGRKCYGMEISPAYCDVIVQRWEKLTGKQATLDGSGMTFEEAKSARWEQ
jgi:DNA modification methylase